MVCGWGTSLLGEQNYQEDPVAGSRCTWEGERPALVPAGLGAGSQLLNIGEKVDTAVGFLFQSYLLSLGCAKLF